jgi:tetratricopeptide (TPR) repeat protein
VPDADGDGDDDEVSARAQVTGQEVREAAHRYLEDGLLPVPAWAARQNGECCCPRGADCDRPGKHPRSVHTGPGPRAYSWKPLACRTHAEVDQRFGPGGQYAAGNLMVAIPAGMMAIDRDDDDGGRVALAALKGELGELPPTLSHRTPHGEHLIYRTPGNWKGRAWVGKDPANPVPPGIDLRMPGQILMAAPSVVPGPGGPAQYGPVTGDRVAALPAAYVTAWTPPTTQPRPAAHRVPVPPDSADRAAKYVHDAMTRIADDLASRKPGGRNAAAYAAGLKAGSLLGAARATPGAGQAAAAWTDEEAEQALMDAAARNGYTGKDGEAEARRAIRSGLRNGLRSPRALPDFTTSRPAPDRQQPQHRPAPSGPARPQRGQAATAAGRRASRWQDMVPGDIRREIEGADTAASDRRRVAIAAHQQALERHGQSATADTAAEVERTRAVAHAAHQEYTHDGRHVTGRHNAAMLRWAAAIAAQREHAAAPLSPGPADSTRAQANQAAVAANEAYREGDLDRARQLTDRAAALDPSRAELWQQHRQQIAARRLILDARAAHAEGDRQRAHALLGDARQLDPRMPAIWDGDLEAGPGHRATAAPGPADGEVPKLQWPSSPARSEPRPAPAAAQRADSVQPPPTATPREPRRHVNAARDNPDPTAEPVAREQSARWPAPSPRAGDAPPPGQQARHEMTARPEPAGRQQPRAATETEPGGNTSPERPGALSADWRDQVLSEARQPWQPAPGWPHNPSLHRPPEAGNPGAGIELSEPTAS